MSKTEFPVELVERCARAGLPSFRSAGWWVFSPSEGDMSDVERERWEATTSATAAVLRESGHAELVAALKEARDFAVSVESVEGDCYGDPAPRIDAALRKAGAL